MRLLLIVFLFTTLLVSCGGNSEEQPATFSGSDSVSNEPLYPYPQYIESQLVHIDSMPLAIEKMVFENGKLVDSTYIDRSQLKTLAEEFSEPDLNREDLRQHYDEKSYQDLTIGTVTFSITAQKDTLPVQQVDILLDPKTKKVKNVIIKKQQETSEGIEVKNMLWVNNMNFQISSTLSRKDGSTTDKVVKVIWDRPLN